MSERNFEHTLNIDVETFSTEDIKKGVHKYTTGSELLLFAYSFDKGPVKVVDIAQGEEIPAEIQEAIFDEKVLKKAWNAAFEIEQLEKYFFEKMILSQWQCTMVKAARCGYPLGLDKASKAIGLPVEKDSTGKSLIRLFSVPRKPTKNNPATRTYPEDQPEKWEEFKRYNKQDVVVEMHIDDFLSQYPEQPEFEHKMYVLDRQINKRGLQLDIPFIKKVIKIDTEYKKILLERAKELTGLDNPNSLQQIKGWLEEKTGKIWKGLDKAVLKSALEDGEIPYAERNEEGEEVLDGSIVGVNITPLVREVLELRKELSNTSVRKYTAMLGSEIHGRIYDTIQFNGAGRTGRNAGRLIQPQNLPRISMKDFELDTARKLVQSNDLETLLVLYDSVSDVLSQLIRTALVAASNKRLLVCDLSAIEARVVAWLAGEEFVLDVFRTHGKIYEATAAMMFKVPFESITKDSKMRQRGKVASLACSYGGGPNAITTMDLDKSIPEEEKPGLVKAWRAANPNITQYWYRTGDAAIKAIQNPGEKVPLSKGAYFVTCKDALLFYLPSGRYLMYPKVGLEEGQYGKQITFWGLNQTTNNWEKQRTYGSRLVENACQGVARDVLMYGMYNIVRKGYDLVTNVHDETVSENELGFGSVQEIEQLMCEMPEWAEGLPLAADGFESDYYKK